MLNGVDVKRFNWISDSVNRTYETAKIWIDEITKKRGKENVKKSFREVNPLINSNRWIRSLMDGLKEKSPACYNKLMKFREVKPKFLESNKERLRLLLLDKLTKKDVYGGFFHPSLFIIEQALKESIVGKISAGMEIRTDLLGSDEALKNLAFLMGYSTVSKEEGVMSVLLHVAKLRRLGSVKIKVWRLLISWIFWIIVRKRII